MPDLNRRELQTRVDELLQAEARYVARIRELEEALIGIADMAYGIREELEGLLDPDHRLPGEPEPGDMRGFMQPSGPGVGKSITVRKASAPDPEPTDMYGPEYDDWPEGDAKS